MRHFSHRSIVVRADGAASCGRKEKRRELGSRRSVDKILAGYARISLIAFELLLLFVPHVATSQPMSFSAV